MSEPCSHEEDFGRIKSDIKRMDRDLYGNGKAGLSITVIELSAEVKNLEKTADQLRVGVSGLLKFQNEYDGAEKRSAKSWKIVAVIISFIVMASGLYQIISFDKINKSNDGIETQIKEVMDIVYEPKFRSAVDSLYSR